MICDDCVERDDDDVDDIDDDDNLESDYGEVRFVTAVIADGSVKFLPAVKISPSHSFFVFLSPKLLKYGEIKGVNCLAV